MPDEKLVLFDLDGTLIDSDNHIVDPFHRYLHRVTNEIRPQPVTYEEFLVLNKNMHAAHGSSITGWQLHFGQDEVWTKGHFRACAPILAKVVVDAITEDDVLLTELEALRMAGYTIGVLTHSHETYAEETMRKAGLLRVINLKDVFGMDRAKGLKTVKETYENVLKDGGWQHIANRIMVENLLGNLAMARATGFLTAYTTAVKDTPLAVVEEPVDFHHAHIHQTCAAIRQHVF